MNRRQFRERRTNSYSIAELRGTEAKNNVPGGPRHNKMQDGAGHAAASFRTRMGINEFPFRDFPRFSQSPKMSAQDKSMRESMRRRIDDEGIKETTAATNRQGSSHRVRLPDCKSNTRIIKEYPFETRVSVSRSRFASLPLRFCLVLCSIGSGDPRVISRAR